MNYLQISPFIGYTNSIVWGAYLGILLWAGLVFILLLAICCFMLFINNSSNVRTHTFDEQIQLLQSEDDDWNARSQLNLSQQRILRNICIDALIMLMFLIVYYLLILLSGWELLDEPYSTILFFLALVAEFQLHWYRIGTKYYEKISYKMPVDLTQSDEQCVETRAEQNQWKVNLGKIKDKQNNCQEANNRERKKYKRKIEKMREKLFVGYILYSFAVGFYCLNILKYHCPSGELGDEEWEFSYAIQANRSIVASYLIKELKQEYPQFDVKIVNSIGNNQFFAQSSVMTYKNTNINLYQAGISEEVLVDEYNITFQSYSGASIVHKPINEVVQIAIISNLFDLDAINAADFKQYDFIIFTGNFAQDLGKKCCMNRQRRFLKQFQSIPIMVVPGLLENGQYNDISKFPYQQLYYNTFHPNNNTVSYNPNSYQTIFNTQIQIVTDFNQNIIIQEKINQLIIIVPFSIHCNIDKFTEWYNKQLIHHTMIVKLVESGQLEQRQSNYLGIPIIGGGSIGQNIYKVKQECQDNNNYIKNDLKQDYIELTLRLNNDNKDDLTKTTIEFKEYIKSQ